jgi:hypothetical protein
MADVTGPIRTLPGSIHNAPEGTRCDDHPERIAYKRVQGETDSFGSEMIDMCEECYNAFLKEQQEADHSGHCDWCKTHKPRVRPRRDFEEGSAGPVYQVCDDCIQKENDRVAEELAETGPSDDYYDFDPGDDHWEDYEDRPDEHLDDDTFPG